MFAGCAAFIIGADPWDPLADWGVLILPPSAFALGLISGRWRMLLAALALLALGPLNRGEEPDIFAFLVVPMLCVECCAAIAAGVGVRRVMGRRRARAVPRLGTAGLAIMGLAIALTAWGVYLDQRVVDRTPSRPLLVDERTGAYRGVAPGTRVAQVVSLFGRPVPGSDDLGPSPLGAGAAELSGPSSLSVTQSWRYRDLAVLHARGTVRGYLTTDPRAETAAGVGIGDSLTIARRAYAGLECGGQTIGSDASNPAYLACSGRLPGGDEIWFGGDPIDSIWVLQGSEDLTAGSPPLRRRR